MPRIGIDSIEPDKPVEIKPKEAPIEPELKSKSGGILSAFISLPQNTTFQGEEENETILILLRAHAITNVPWILVTIILILSPIFLFPLFLMTNIFPPIPGGFAFIGTIFWYLGTFTYALISFLYWYFNVYIITNERVVDVDWFSLIYRRVVTAQVSKIQDVSNTIGGVIRSVFDFGNVHIETAGEMENIEFENIPHPALVAKQIEHLMQHEEQQWEEHP